MIASPFLKLVADSSTSEIMREYVTPTLQGMCVFASLICVFFLVNGGIRYVTSSGKPERLESAKSVLRNALIGLVIVLAAGSLTAILNHSFHQAAGPVATHLPALSDVKPESTGGGLAGVLIKAVTGFLNNIIQSAAAPFLAALSYFTTSTPLIADNSSVFNLWLALVGIADAIFALVVALLGFHVMSASTFGLDEIEFKHLLPRLALIFALMNSSVFLIDGIIHLSNAMIHALTAGFSQTSVWDVLTSVAKDSGGYGPAALLIMLAFLIFSVILLVYYVGRIVTIYIGAVLSPLVLLLWLVPGFRDFAENAMKTYFSTIFVLFVHVVILELAASLFTGMMAGSATHTIDPLMSMIVGLATLVALLKTQGVMMQLSYASVGPRTARKLGGQFMNGVSYIAGRGKAVAGTVSNRSTNSRTNFSKSSSSKKATTSAASYKQPTGSSKTTSKPQTAKTTQAKTGTTVVAPKVERPKSPIEGDPS